MRPNENAMNWNSPRTGVMFRSVQASRLFRSLRFVLLPWLQTKWLALTTFEGTILETRRSPLHADHESKASTNGSLLQQPILFVQLHAGGVAAPFMDCALTVCNVASDRLMPRTEHRPRVLPMSLMNPPMNTAASLRYRASDSANLFVVALLS
jgi:hypothetical protein